ncbi:MAG TPA: TVP38/TMEM64 family protein [Negativicutes bacterium]|nr:TVP38/TMEM64 family protein [Negativicutes bacterium]
MRHYIQTLSRPAVAGYLAGFIILGVLYVYAFGLERFTPETVRDTVLSMGYWSPLLYILANAVRPFFLFPAMVLAVAGGLAFGPLAGTVYLVIGTALGAALVFATARLLGRDRLRGARPAWLPIEELDDRAARHGFRTILLLRLAPVLPWDAVSVLAGLSRVSFRPYAAATVLGSIPGALAFSYCGDILRQSLFTALALAALIVAASLYLRGPLRRAGLFDQFTLRR